MCLIMRGGRLVDVIVARRRSRHEIFRHSKLGKVKWTSGRSDPPKVGPSLAFLVECYPIFHMCIKWTIPNNRPVVTPSGYIVSRKLLVTKLAENGGVDPWSSSTRLDEGSLIELNTTGGSNVVPPRPPRATSLPNLLSMLQSEYDVVLLELHDTRVALEETRKVYMLSYITCSGIECIIHSDYDPFLIRPNASNAFN